MNDDRSRRWEAREAHDGRGIAGSDSDGLLWTSWPRVAGAACTVLWSGTDVSLSSASMHMHGSIQRADHVTCGSPGASNDEPRDAREPSAHEDARVRSGTRGIARVGVGVGAPNFLPRIVAAWRPSLCCHISIRGKSRFYLMIQLFDMELINFLLLPRSSLLD